MPIQQRTFRRAPRRRYKKQYGMSVGGSIKGYGLAISANAKANYALSQLNTEEKVIDVSGSAGGAPGGSMSLLNGLVQGTSNTTRIGDSVRFKNISMRVAYQGHSTEDIWYRYMIVRDRAPNGSTASVTNVLSSASVQSHRNLDYTKRFTVLSDRVLYLPAGGNSVDGGFTQLYLDLEKITKGNKKGKQKNESSISRSLNRGYMV